MSYKSSFSDAQIEKLYEAILLLNNKDEVNRFFEDLCTIKEIKDMSLRLEVAKMLNKGISYQEISDKTKASSATISRIAKSLSYGASGYEVIINKLKNK